MKRQFSMAAFFVHRNADFLPHEARHSVIFHYSQSQSSNSKRQELVNEIMGEAQQQVDRLPQDQPVLLVVGHDWHQGVLGIVAVL